MSRRDAQQALEQGLEESRAELLSGSGPPALLKALQSACPDLSDNLYIIEHIPKQGEDSYDVLVDATTVVHIEIPRPGVSQSAAIEQMSLERYRKIHSALSKLGRRRLDAVLRVARRRQSKRSA